MSQAIVHLSSLAGSPLLDSAGERLGRVEDVVARLDLGDGLPPVIGLKARIGGRELFVPISRIERLEPAAARTSTTKLNLAQFERRPGEVLLRADLLDHSLINVDRPAGQGARGGARVRGRGLARRRNRREPPAAPVAPAASPLPWPRQRAHQFVPWGEIGAVRGPRAELELKLAARRIARLHPAQIADLVEAASHEEGEEILRGGGSGQGARGGCVRGAQRRASGRVPARALRPGGGGRARADGQR